MGRDACYPIQGNYKNENKNDETIQLIDKIEVSEFQDPEKKNYEDGSYPEYSDNLNWIRIYKKYYQSFFTSSPDDCTVNLTLTEVIYVASLGKIFF